MNTSPKRKRVHSELFERNKMHSLALRASIWGHSVTKLRFVRHTLGYLMYPRWGIHTTLAPTDKDLSADQPGPISAEFVFLLTFSSRFLLPSLGMST